MKNQKNHSQLKDQEKSPERTMKQTSFNKHQLQKGGNEDTEGIRKAINRNADYCKKK